MSTFCATSDAQAKNLEIYAYIITQIGSKACIMLIKSWVASELDNFESRHFMS